MSDEAKLTLTGRDAALILKENGEIQMLLPKQHLDEQVYSTSIVVSAFAFAATKQEWIDKLVYAMSEERGNTRGN